MSDIFMQSPLSLELAFFMASTPWTVRWDQTGTRQPQKSKTIKLHTKK